MVFNNLLRSARNPIECAFGRLKARWAVLSKKVDLDLTIVPSVIFACFVLHNFCERSKTYVDEELVRSQIQVALTAEADNQPDRIYSCDNSELVRDILTKYITLNLPDYLNTH